MYTYTDQGLQQVRAVHAALGGTLDAPSFSPAIDEFVKQVRQRPLAYKKLLLTITFHPTPNWNPVYGKLSFVHNGKTSSIIEELISSGIQEGDFLDALRRIRDAYRKDNETFRNQIEAELRLQKRIFKTVGRVMRDAMLRTGGNAVPQELESVFLDALLMSYSYDSWRQVLNFGRKFLPSTLVDRIMKSEVSEAHWANLGRMLRRYGEVMQKRDAAFKRRVEQERMKRAAAKTKQP